TADDDWPSFMQLRGDRNDTRRSGARMGVCTGIDDATSEDAAAKRRSAARPRHRAQRRDQSTMLPGKLCRIGDFRAASGSPPIEAMSRVRERFRGPHAAEGKRLATIQWPPRPQDPAFDRQRSGSPEATSRLSALTPPGGRLRSELLQIRAV